MIDHYSDIMRDAAMHVKIDTKLLSLTFLVALNIRISYQHPSYDVASHHEESREDLGNPLTEENFYDALTEVYSDDGVPDEDQSASLFEGDIVLNEDDKKALAEGGKEQLREIVGLSIRKWPKGDDGLVQVPYYIPNGMPGPKKSQIARVVLEYQTKTCIRFVRIFS